MESGTGFLLLTSHLGNPDRKPLTVAQLRNLSSRVQNSSFGDVNVPLTEKHLVSLGYDYEMSRKILGLLNEEELLNRYLSKAKQNNCIPITRQDSQYPLIVRKRLGMDSPGCLWAKGDLTLLDQPAVAVVGSRELHEENLNFAKDAGKKIAEQGFILVSGNAHGADRVAQEACLAAGGCVIVVVADSLTQYSNENCLLYLSEEDYDAPFSSQRALRRNRVIHALGRVTLVAQCTLGSGGTWNGTLQNLKNGWSDVFCFQDDSASSRELEQLGAGLICRDELNNLRKLIEWNKDLFSNNNR